MRVKTAELIGQTLDYAVALCEGYYPYLTATQSGSKRFIIKHPSWSSVLLHHLTYSVRWEFAGVIIEREGISILNLDANAHDVSGWQASIGELWSPEDDGWVSPTPLIAAMRCYVQSKLGDEVEVPNELLSVQEPTNNC